MFNGRRRRALLSDQTPQALTEGASGLLHYRLRESHPGTRRRLVLIHSLGLDATLWNPVLTHLPADMAVCAYDCRGHGSSKAGILPYTLDGFAEDLLRLMDHLQWPTAALAGCSMGGCVAMQFAASYPERATALTLIDTTAWYGPDASILWAQRATAAMTHGMAMLGTRQAEHWLSPDFRARHPQVAEDMLACFARTAPASFAATCAMLGATDLRPVLPRIEQPVHVIVGSEDALTPPADARALAAAIPRARLTILDGARHLTPLERAPHIAGFIANP